VHLLASVLIFVCLLFVCHVYAFVNVQLSYAHTCHESTDKVCVSELSDEGRGHGNKSDKKLCVLRLGLKDNLVIISVCNI